MTRGATHEDPKRVTANFAITTKGSRLIGGSVVFISVT